MKHIATILLLIISTITLSQNISDFNPELAQLINETGEVHFRFSVEDPNQIGKLSSIIEIDNVVGNEVFAYAKPQAFAKFLTFGFPYQIIIDPLVNESDFNMLAHVNMDEITDWDFYPTYEAYIEMMEQFAVDYPEICQVFSIGKSVDGRDLMMAKISDNIATREAEPQFLYTGTMHGDELAGYVLLLRLIDYLLSNYGTDPKVTNLVNSLEIWINPSSNPDGTYAGGNNTVSGSTRNNANNVNLNRNYPDPEDGQHPDGNAWQAETLLFMQLAEDNHFVMSANTHGGAEVINYPWDTWLRLSADDSWWVYVSREYVDTVHVYSPSTYMDGFVNGITNGYAWYSISGGRQDYMNYFHHCREVTMELSNVKKLASSQLESHWNWNYRSLLNYMEQCTYGVSGVVTDLNTGEPLAAKIYIEGHDEDNSFVYADDELGFYQRHLDEGTYDITFSFVGYTPVTIENVSVSKYTSTQLNVQLNSGSLNAAFSASQTEIGQDGSVDFYDESSGNPIAWLWQFEGATPSESSDKNPGGIKYAQLGSYDVSLTVYNAVGDSSLLLKENYILISDEIIMHSGSLEACSGLFYDSGGSTGNYENDLEFTLTLNPGVSGAKMSVDFEEFELEANAGCSYDWLKIFDGPTTSAALIGTYCGTGSPGEVIASGADGSLTFQFHSDYSETRPGWKASISCRMEQNISMQAGWTGISSFVKPDNPNLEAVFENILNDLVILRAGDGVYWPEQNVNSLGEWNSAKGYLIKLKDNAQLNLVGSVSSLSDIDLIHGWNLLPVVSSCPVSILDLIDGSGVQVDFIMEVAGTNIYWPALGISTLQQLEPGKSYYVKSTGSGTITFPVCD
jgi:PKD repeat protein